MPSRSRRQDDGPLLWIKWFPGDWLGDEKLQLCSLAAQGLWKNCLCLMHRATPYGHLLVNGKAPTDDTLARMMRCTAEDIRRLLNELIVEGVASQTAASVIYSRRMVRDRRRSEVNAANGANGGNPRLTASETPALQDSRLSESDNRNPQSGLSEPDNRNEPRLTESVNQPGYPTRLSGSDIPRARDRAIAQEAEAEAETEAKADLPSGIDQPSGARQESAPPQPDSQPEPLTLKLKPPPTPRVAAMATAAAKSDQTRFMRAWAAKYLQHRRQNYGRSPDREWGHVKAMIAQYGFDRLWIMAEKFIIEPSGEYPFNGGRTIAEFYAHRHLIEGRLIELGILPPAKPQETTDVA